MSKLARSTVVLVLGIALSLVFVFAAKPSAVLADDQPDGSIIDLDQDVHGTWGPGTITATADVTIQSGVVITVAPNTTIVVADGVGFTINGDLHSDGPVTFTTASSPATPGAWSGVTYAADSTGYLNQATVEYAVHALTLDTLSPINITNSTLRYNRHATTTNPDAFGAGLTIMRGDHLIDHTDIYSNSVSTTFSGADVYGGGIDIRTGNSQIRYSRIYENSAATATGATGSHGSGGGIVIRGGSPLIQYCEILTNTLYARRQDNTYSGAGAGIGIYDITGAEIRNNWIAYNVNTSRAAAGGGIGFRANVSANIIDGNVIAYNVANHTGYAGEGAGIDDWGASTFIASNNLIYGNTTNGEGGGIATWRANNARVFNNTIVGNTAATGGGVYRHYGIYFNNIIANNTATSAGGIQGCDNTNCGYNDVWNNTPNNYGGTVPSTDVSVDPLFVGTGDLAEWYHLLKTSPVVNAGTNSGIGLPSEDYDGEPRPVYTGWDIGFDEVTPKFDVVKTAALDSVRPDQVLHYVIVISNTGSGDATGVIISDTLPANTQFVDGSITLDPPSAGTVGTTPPTLADGISLAAGETVTVSYDVTVNSSFSPMCVDAIHNVVEVNSDQGIESTVTLATPINYDQTIMGTLSTSATWCPGTITVTGDVLIASSTVITVTPGVTVLVADTDGNNLGVDAARIEFIVDNNAGFVLYGPSTFTSLAASPAPADWYGIRYLNGSHGWVDGATIEYGVHGLTLDTSNPITISNSIIRHNRHAPSSGQDAFGAGIAIVAGSHLVTNSQIYDNALLGVGSGGDALGGGIDIQGPGSRIISSSVHNNTAQTTGTARAVGGGISIRGTGNDSLIEDCQVTTNTVRAQSAYGGPTYDSGHGAGIGIHGATVALIRHNWIGDNQNISYYAAGGGIALDHYAEAALIDGNVVYNNVVDSSSGIWSEGAGIDMWGDNVITVTNNLIHNNMGIRGGSGSPCGGGILVNAPATGDDVYVYNNTIVGNQANQGGGVFIQQRGVVINNIVVGNTATDTGGGIYRSAGGYIGGRFDYNDIWGNTPNQYVNLVTPNTNISVDPLFLGVGNLAQQYHVLYSSPVIDAGTNANVSDDYDGDPRPLYDGYDIGFDEVTLPDLTVVKSGHPDPVKPGETLSYTIVISNSGLDEATGVVVSDTLPANTQFVLGSIVLDPPDAGTSGTAPPTLATDIAVGAGQRVTVTYAVVVENIPLPICVDRIENVVEVTSDQEIGDSETISTSLSYDQIISGTITISKTWCAGIITVTGDVLISSGAIITVAPQTTLRIADVDGNNLGVDDQRIEFIVENNTGFQLNGPVTFTSLDATPAPADWYGIRYLNGSHGWVDGATIEYGVHGLTLDTINPITISNSAIRYNRHAPATGDAYGAGVHIVQGNHLISNTHIYDNTAQPIGNRYVRGAGIYIQNGSPQIINSWIYENTAIAANYPVYGGGIGINVGGALIEGCHILTNTITGGTGNQLRTGAGIGIIGNSTAIIRNNWIDANTSNVVGYAAGAGIGFNSNARVNLIDSNVIANNQAIGLSYGEGGGIDAWENNAFTAVNNLIYNNLVQDLPGGSAYGAEGGGIFANGASTKYLNNTIIANTAQHGGGVARQDDSGDLYNNIVVGNHATATSGGGGIYRSRGDAGTAGYNNVWGNTPDNYNSPLVIPTTDFQVDPLLIDAGDLVQRYHLRLDSPLIDVGTDTLAGIPDHDYDGDPRPSYTTWDIGFDEVPEAGILKRVGPFSGAGGPLDYTISIVNEDGVAHTYRLTDVLPLNTTYGAGPSCNLGTCDYDGGSDTITWDGDIPAGDMLVLDYTVVVDAPLPEGTEITNTATISTPSGIVPTNRVTTIIYNPAFSLDKARSGGSNVAGANGDYRITVLNTSTSGPATDVVVTETVPAGVNLVSAWPSASVSGDTATWTIPSVPPGGMSWVYFRAWTCQTSWTNQYYRVVTSTQGVDSGLGRTRTTNLVPPTIVPEFDVEPFVLDRINVGETVYFTSAGVTNGRPIADWHWDFDDGAATTGETVSHVYATSGAFTVTLTVTDECGFTGSTTKTLIVNAPSFDVTKSVEPEGAIEPGDVLNYTIVVTNAGPGYATDVTLSDPLPDHTAYVPGSSQVTAPVSQSFTYRDELAARAYNGSDGTIDWSSQPWVEFGDSSGATGGYVSVVSDLGDYSIGIRYSNRGVSRQADLSGYTSAMLTFEYRRYSFDVTTDYVMLEVSDDGGVSWTELDRFAGPRTDAAYRRVGYDITDYVSSMTVIRFRSPSSLAGNDYFYIDNVQIKATDYQMVTAPGGAPPALASGAALEPGQRMTVTYAVTVTPPVAGDTVITNIASVTSDEVSTPATGTVTSIVLNVAPVAVDDTDSTDEDSPVTIGVLGNDTDQNGDTLNVDSVDTTGTQGTVTNNTTDVTYDPDGAFEYLAVGESAEDVFAYTVSDGNGGYDTAMVTVTVTGVNDGPAAVDDEATTDEDSSVVVDVLDNDSDPDGTDVLSVDSVDTTGTQGTVTNNTTDVTYDPDGVFESLAVGESAEDVFAYTISDGNGGFDTAVVTVTVTGVNDGPMAVDDEATTDEDSSVVVDVLDNDSDPDGTDVLSVDSVDPTGTQGAVTNNGTDVTYDPDGAFESLAVGESAEDVFAYTVSDGNGGYDTAVVTVTVTGVNDDPVANDDTASTDEDTAVTIDVLDNDTDVEGDSLTVDSVTPPANGMVSNYGSYVVYTPDADFDGTDTFDYTARDGNGGFGTATVTVTVNPVNDAPVANNDTDSTDEDIAVTIDVLGNDTDVDGDTLFVDSVTQPANGTVVNNGSDVTYTPDEDFYGTDTFVYGVSDGNGGSDIAMVVVTVDPVNDDPDASDDTAVTSEDTAVTIDVLDNDTDVDGDSLTVDAIGTPTTGTVTINLDYTVTYTPEVDFNGTDHFTYTVGDGNGGSATATVAVRVGPVNDVPVADDDTDTTDEDVAVTIDVLGNDTDLDGDSLFVDSVTQPANGAVVNNSGDVTYTPDDDFYGEDVFTYIVSDGFGGSDTATVTVTVNSVNDDPDAVDDSATVAEDSVGNVIDVLVNDTDAPDVGETLTIVAVGLPDSGGSASTDGSTVTYAPAADFFGTEALTYTIADGNGGSDMAVVTVDVTNVNDDPDAVDDGATVAEDSVDNVIDVLANDADAPDAGETLTIVTVGLPDSGGSASTGGSAVTYTPAAGFIGTETFTYTIADGNGGSDTAMVTVDVTNVNDDPDAVDDGATVAEDSVNNVIDVLTNDTDVEGDTLAVHSVSTPANGTTINNGSDVTYTPLADFNGTDVFTYTVGDGNGGTDVASVTVTVTPINDAPVANDDSYSVEEGGTLTESVPGVLGNDIDVEADTLTATLVSDVANGALVFNTDGSFIYEHDGGESTSDSFTYDITDGDKDSEIATVTITIIPVNEAPIAYDDSAITSEDIPVTINVLINDTDVDHDSLIVDSVTQPASGVVVNNGSDVTYTPDADFNGWDSFTYIASDGNGGTCAATVSVFVEAINDAPTLVDVSKTGYENTTVTFALSDFVDQFVDVDGNSLVQVKITSLPVSGTLYLDGNPVSVDQEIAAGDLDGLAYEPNMDYVGPDSFGWNASDGVAYADSDAQVNVIITGPAPAPPITYVFLPVVMNVQASTPAPGPYPDLVVESITVTSDSAQVVIRNQGGAPVLAEDTFWVDLYVDPNPAPTGVNQTWNDRCRYGIVWGVTPPLLPINPGDTIVLTMGDVYYSEDFSDFPESLPSGTSIYVQVDSANAETDYGGVLESHEVAGESYNNISGPVLSTAGPAGDGSASPTGTDEHVPASYHLPPRP